MELAEEVLALFYQARDVIGEIRNPGGFASEGTTRKPSPGEEPEHKEGLDRAFVLIERYQRHSELFSRLHTLRYRFMAQLGKDAGKPFDELNRVINELLSAAYMMSTYVIREPTFPSPGAAERYWEGLTKFEKLYYAGFEDDPVAPRVEALTKSMEATCSAIITSSGTLHSVFNLRIFGRKR
jgi:hypothetical protein